MAVTSTMHVDTSPIREAIAEIAALAQDFPDAVGAFISGMDDPKNQFSVIERVQDLGIGPHDAALRIIPSDAVRSFIDEMQWRG